MGALWTFEPFRQAVGGNFEGAPPADITGISIDTRTIAPGEAFFAITGERMDGHDFAVRAVEAGAAVAVVSASKRGHLGGNGPFLVLDDDPLDGLVRLGRILFS